jgi:hypothetical protein
MGDRVSISFKKSDEESVTLFAHWGGREFAEEALTYARELKREREGSVLLPIDRLEPNTVMVDFIRELTSHMRKDQRVDGNFYLGIDEYSGDNSDNGHFTINLDALEFDLSQ